MNSLQLLGALAAASLAPPMAEAPMNNPCAHIQWSASFLYRYPRLAAACQKVEVQNGIKYAKFTGRVVLVNTHHVVVAVVNEAGVAGGAIKWKTPAEDDLTINDKQSKIGDLNKGDTLTFWIQEGKLTVSEMPGGKGQPFANAKHPRTL
jgi:hypothetical protein